DAGLQRLGERDRRRCVQPDVTRAVAEELGQERQVELDAAMTELVVLFGSRRVDPDPGQPVGLYHPDGPFGHVAGPRLLDEPGTTPASDAADQVLRTLPHPVPAQVGQDDEVRVVERGHAACPSLRPAPRRPWRPPIGAPLVTCGSRTLSTMVSAAA